jgi:hypothetical protein
MAELDSEEAENQGTNCSEWALSFVKTPEMATGSQNEQRLRWLERDRDGGNKSR